MASVKRLCLVRHAKSSWDDPSLDDFERPLNDRGKKDAPRMAKRFKEKEQAADLLYSSPAKRAWKTCKAFAEILNVGKSSIKADEALYHADEDSLLQLVRGLSDKRKTVLLFGHNPGLTSFANLLTGESIMNIPTCGMAMITFRVKKWKEVSAGKGKLEFFDFPKNNVRP